MRKYEIMYIIDQDSKNLEDVQKKLNDILVLNDGKIIEKDDWGLKDFAYEIKHKKKGYYSVIISETTPENIEEFQRVARIDPDVVRTLVINTETEKRYVQSTKLSKTDMSKFKEEKKYNNRGFDKRDRYESKDGKEKSFERKEKFEKPANDEVKSKETIKKDTETK